MAKKTSTRRTIAYFAPFIERHINLNRFLGIADHALEEGVNLICFITHFLHEPIGFDRQANVLFDLVSPDVFDGLIVGDIFMEDVSGSEEISSFFRAFTLPLVTFRQTDENVPFIPMDNYESMAELLRHMIKVHDRRKIVFVRGPAQHPHAQGRYQAYLDTLPAEGIEIDENLVPPARSFWWQNAFHVLLDERKLIPGKDFNAVVCAGDLNAIDVMRTLQSRGFHVPEDVSISGVNNLIDGTVVTPTLTSIELNFYEKGKMACEMILSLVAGQPVETTSRLTSKIILRESCGCIDPDIMAIPIEPESAGVVAKKSITEARRVFIERCSALQVREKAAEALADAFFREINSETRLTPQFLPLFHAHLVQSVIGRAELDSLHGFISSLRKNIVPLLDSIPARERAETLFQQMRVAYAKTQLAVERRRVLEEENNFDSIRALGRSLLSTFNIEEMMDVVALWLSAFGIPGCSVVLYADPSKPAECARLILSVRDGERIPLPAGGLYFPTRQIVPLQCLPADRPYCLIVSAMYSRDRQIGYIVFEQTRRDTLVYELIKGQIDNALQIALSVEDLEDARENLSRKAHELERSNRELEQFASVASHDLQEPLRKITTMAGRIRVVEDRNLSPKTADYIVRMISAADRMQTLINDLLEYSRVTKKPRPFEKVDLAAVCTQVIGDLEMRIQKAQGKVECGKLYPLEAEPVLMRQLLQNLIGNALKFRKPDVKPVVRIATSKIDDKWCELSVADNGIGIPEEHHTRIFEIFERLHSRAEYEGSGIGLSICTKIVEYHRGSIRVENSEGNGTTFFIRLPFVQVTDRTDRA